MVIARRLLPLVAVLALTACGTPVPTGGASPAPTGPAASSPAPTSRDSGASPTSSTPDPSDPPTSASPSAADTPEVPEDQRLRIGEVAEFDDGLLLEIAGAAADRARKNEKGAERTGGEMIIVSVRLENGTRHNYDPRPIRITATYGDGTAAQLMKDSGGNLQPGFGTVIEPRDETVATLGFAVPRSGLGSVTLYVDPRDGTHEPVAFAGKVRRI